ncbi:exosome complex RNA-binding protein Csl4 [Candidatus Bathyarchaeota archaeon]|nr:exosome complex RNA-binding protein Csl4 [Candidatus Bathyarchaeota archaeon]
MNSQSPRRKSGQFVVPGERLGVIEEFTPSSGTYVQEGVIYSKVTGRALLDFPNKRVSVHSVTREVRVPRVGSIVLGQVSSVQSQKAFVRVFKIGDKQLSGFFTGILYISDVQLRYVDSMFAVCKPCDIIRAKVISEKNRTYHLSTVDKTLGVVYAFCSRCGYMLELRRRYMLCPRCGKDEKRKVASDYGKGVI